MKESYLEKKICKALRLAGAFAVPIVGKGTKGVPDVLVCHLGVLFTIEIKLPGEDPDPHQVNLHAKLRANGGRVYVARSVEDALAALADATG